ncbi:hypothetical protein BT96DRAFT_991869 [Gymnopus androsaceus JB14]|uniref:Uncharacterized protein n=1 Tax=Gymnopus androsaceus JB14 TaxID=1447944 RepID=A0A6A4HYN9_9AGAR|nr:hypothetical protein BT96DRAFT_991869 [Gymnopus androsaceus JB14]
MSTQPYKNNHNLTLRALHNIPPSSLHPHSGLPLPLHPHLLTRPCSQNPSLLHPNSTLDSASSTGIAPLRPTSSKATNYMVVPQRVPRQLVKSVTDIASPLVFRRKGHKEPGVRLSNCLGFAVPELEYMNDRPFKNFVYREITIHIEWPGYSHYGQRMQLGAEKDLSRADILTMVTQIIQNFIHQTKKHELKCEPTQEHWRLERTDIRRLYITRLIHRGGSYWQPEILCSVFDA